MDDIRGGGGSRFYLDDEATQVDLKKRFIIFQSYSCPDQTSESINKQLLHLLSRGALASLTGQSPSIPSVIQTRDTHQYWSSLSLLSIGQLWIILPSHWLYWLSIPGVRSCLVCTVVSSLGYIERSLQKRSLQYPGVSIWSGADCQSWGSYSI